MKIQYRLLSFVPMKKRKRIACNRWLAERAFEKEIKAAKEAKQSKEQLQSIYTNRRYEFDMLDEEDDIARSDTLVKKAKRYDVVLPPVLDEVGAYTKEWNQGAIYGQWTLTDSGCALLREEIRKEKKALHEERKLWVTWVPAFTGLIGSLIGLLAIYKK